MRNLFKKSLTLCLVAILAFSCFAGIVSAETAYTATIAVVDQTITPGTTSVDVVLNITSSQIGINEALIEVSSDIGTINSKATLDEATAAIASIELPEGSTNYGSFYLSAKNDISGETTVLGSIATASITVTFTVDENKAVGTYPINIAVDGVRAASGDEDVITFTYATANVTIAEPHVHEYTYTPNGDKTHNGACACNEAPITNEACVDGDDEDLLCDKCNFDLAEEEVCEHVWEVTDAAPGTAVDAPGFISLTCTECGVESNNNVVNYHGKFRCNSNSLELKSEIVLGFENSTDRYSSIPDGAASGVAYGFVVFTDKDDSIVSTLDIVDDKKVSASGKYMYELKVPSYDMLDTFGSTCYAYCDGKWYSGKTYSASIAGLVTANFNSFDDARKKLYVDLLNYGAAVQTRFGIKTDALANSTLTPEQSAYGTSETTPPAEYTAPAIDNTKDVYTTAWALETESKVVLRYKFNAKNFKNNRGYTDATNLKAVVTYKDAWDTDHTNTYNYDSTTTDLFYDKDLFTLVSGKTNQYEMAYLDFTACDFRIPITISFYDHEGNQVDQAVTVSVENLIATAIGSASAEQVAMYNAILNYCDSARAVFVG